MPEIIVHHLDNSRSQRILFLLEELELPYEIKLYKRDGKTMRAPESLRAVHPLGKAPVVSIDGVVHAESGAIIEAVVDQLGPHLRPEVGSVAHRRYRFFMLFAEGSLATPLLVSLITQKIATAPMPFFAKPVAKQIAAGIHKNYTKGELERHFTFLDGELAERAWFAGDDFSAADVQLSFGVEAASSRGATGERPHLRGWLDRIHARPAYQRALERGGPYLYS